jgi:hypothetical protein
MSMDRVRRRFSSLPATALALAFALTLCVLALGFSRPAATAQTAGGRLDSQLTSLVEDVEAGKSTDASADIQAMGVDAGAGEVRVIIEPAPGAAVDTGALTRSGATIEMQAAGLVQARAQVGALRSVAATPGVDLVRVPLRAVPLVTSQGVALTNADDWHAGGLTGAGVRVAILDLGFDGYEAKLGTELPSTVTAISFRADGDIHGGDQPHGTGVAEVVHDMAPGAQLYLVNFDTEVELAAATTWIADQGIDIVNASWGYFASGPGDGTGLVDSIVSSSVDQGIFWSVAAGNHAQRQWSGLFVDTDADGFHEFTTGATPDEGNEVIGSFLGIVLAGERVSAELKWDDPFGAACRDYDLLLLRTEGQQLITVAASQNVQHNAGGCVPNADPTEGFIIAAPVTDTYHLVVQEKFAPTDANIHLFTWSQDLEYRVLPGTILQPGDNPDVTTVGAVPAASPDTIETFSSRGPTKDLRIKPDITAPDAVANSVYGSFAGTSAASPHVAGAAALLLEALPCFAPPQTGAFLETQTQDLGAPGKDNTFGAGRLSLGMPPQDLDDDGINDACDPNADGDIFPDATETTCGVVSLGPNVIPERIDGAFAAVDDDGDTAIDEPLPPAAAGFDCDGDGYTGTGEVSIYFPATTADQDPCGGEGWPSELFTTGGSVNKLNLQDVLSFVVPIRHLDTNPGDDGFSLRWDLLPGPGLFGKFINIQDLTALILGPTGNPPMIGGRAFNLECPWP